MLTPLDIQKQDFGVSFRGYNADEVDDFLDLIGADYEKLYKENIELELKKEFERENIFVKDIIIDVDEKYNVTSLKIFLMDNNDYNSVKNITDKTGIENYEIIRQN